MKRLGLLGGTFDPIHRGHLDVANAAIQALGLSTLWVVPAAVPPHRRPPIAAARHRFAMAALAVESHPDAVVSDLEMKDEAPSYTSDTLARCLRMGLDPAALFFVAGADAFRDISTWKDYPAVLDRCHFVAVSRPDCPASSLRSALPDLASRMVDAPDDVPPTPAIFLVDAPTAPVSSTAVRQRIRDGLAIEDMVPEPVAAYIYKHGLYASGMKDTA